MEKTKNAPPPRPKSKATELQKDMAVIIRNVPPTYNWGWFSREDPRMHVQTVDKLHRGLHYKVWLENRGRRVIEPEPGIPSKVLKSLQAVIIKERVRLDTEWAAFMIANGWLKVKMVGPTITLYAYPNTPNHFERTIELSELVRNPEIAGKVTPQQVALNEEFAFLEIYPERDEAKRIHEPLEKILWTY
jgi:hypothetical protein